MEEKIIHDKILFPYIPTYLSFRESDFIRFLHQKLDLKPDLLMIDGNGILHPLGFGIASHVGVNLDMPSIGVAKSMLCGKLENNNVIYDNKEIGHAYYNSKRVKKPIFISPGHKLNLKNAVSIVKKLCISKIPEPIRRAHILARNNI